MAYANFQVGVKALIFRGSKILTLTTPKGKVDFPGGRLDDNEYKVDFKDCLHREIREELGGGIKCNIGQLAFVSRRDYSYFGQHHIVNLFYDALYESSVIDLSLEHTKIEWLSPYELLNRETLFADSEEFKALKEYLKSRKNNEY